MATFIMANPVVNVRKGPGENFPFVLPALGNSMKRSSATESFTTMEIMTGSMQRVNAPYEEEAEDNA